MSVLIRSRFLVTLLLAFDLLHAIAAASFLDKHKQQLADFQENRERLLDEDLKLLDDDERQLEGDDEESDGSLYSSCGWRRPPCAEGLDCVLAPGGRFCYPMACLKEAAEETYIEQRLDNFVSNLLQKIGFQQPQDMFNDTAIVALQDTPMSGADAANFVVNSGVTERIHAELQEDTTVVNAFRNRAQGCFPQAEAQDNDNHEPHQAQTYYTGLHIETAFGFKFVYQVGGAADENGHVPDEGCYAHICIGLGLDFDAHFAPVLGVLGSGRIGDIKFGAFMADVDAAVGVHFGGALGVTIPGAFYKAEFTGGFDTKTGMGIGIGGGASAYSCTASFVSN